jgi:hypothetical protein
VVARRPSFDWVVSPENAAGLNHRPRRSSIAVAIARQCLLLTVGDHFRPPTRALVDHLALGKRKQDIQRQPPRRVVVLKFFYNQSKACPLRNNNCLSPSYRITFANHFLDRLNDPEFPIHIAKPRQFFCIFFKALRLKESAFLQPVVVSAQPDGDLLWIRDLEEVVLFAGNLRDIDRGLGMRAGAKEEQSSDGGCKPNHG